MKTKHFDCMCSSPDHTLRFMYDKDDVDWNTVYVEIALSHYLPWYKRLWVAVRYVFGYDTPDHFGSWEMDHKDADDLIEMLQEYKSGVSNG